MPRNPIDLTGQRFGCWTVIERNENSSSGQPRWLCGCDCGTEKIVEATNLRYGRSKSYGCLRGKGQKGGTQDNNRANRKLIDLTGQRFGRWIVIERSENSPIGHTGWLCRCDCGTEKVVDAWNLRNGRSKSCGCLRTEMTKKNALVHGMSNSRLYMVWHTMLARCYSRKCKGYVYYGGQGIGVCNEWRYDFVAFYDWAISHGYDENAPQGQCVLGRIDANKDYRPDNCRWTTMAEVSRNRRNRHHPPNIK